ncbi:MAG: hypothetical protein QG671_1547, partial [Actinomycetota bacterium]|nr:hypothetical protein [Actinomycetota bacterium]
RNDYLWGAPPQCPVQVALALPEGSLRLEAPTSSDGDWLEAIADEHGPLLVTASGTEPLGSRTALVRMVGGCRVALTGIDRLRHPETAADLARRGVDLVAVPVGTDLDERAWAAAATRCLERVPVAVLTPSRASLFLPPEGCEQWTEHTLTEPGRLSVPLDVAVGRDRHLFDRLDLETLCGPSGT